ncbi:MAG: hypothetical protein IKV30_03645 [Clostridia bacterium]|nr:hypothetical protein [Clostridia bacterium]
MKNSFNRKFNVVLAVILAFAMVLGMLPISTLAYNKTEGDKLVEMFYDEIVDEYYDDLYSFVHDQAVKYGLFDQAIAEIDSLIAQFEDVKAQIPADVPEEIPEELPEDWPEEIPENWLEQIPQDLLDKIPADLLEELINKYGSGTTQPASTYSLSSTSTDNEYTQYVAYVNQLRYEVDLAIDTLNELKDILEGDGFDTYEDMMETLGYVQEMLPERISEIELLWVLVAAEADTEEIDVEKVLKAFEILENIEDELKNTVIPAADKALKTVAATVYDPACKVLEIFLDKNVDSAEQLVDAFEEVSKMSKEEIEARLKEIAYDATHHEYVIDSESYYVAIGNIYSRNGYVKMLATELDVDYKDLSKNNMTAKKMVEDFASYKAEIAKADLITINFAEVESLLDIIDNAIAYGADYDIDWTQYFGADATKVEKEVDNLVAKLYPTFADQGVDQKYVDTVVGAIEYYVYTCVAHAFDLDNLVAEIKAVNPDAVVVVVGPYNPLNNTTFDYNGTTIEVGTIFDYLYAVFGAFDFVYAVVTEDITFVNVPDVQVELDSTVLTNDVLANISSITLMPSDEGHEYIADKIYDALIITVEDEETEDPVVTPTPTPVPTATPTVVPTATPTPVPTATPTAVPTATPTATPEPGDPSEPDETGVTDVVVIATSMLIASAAVVLFVERKRIFFK